MLSFTELLKQILITLGFQSRTDDLDWLNDYEKVYNKQYGETSETEKENDNV